MNFQHRQSAENRARDWAAHDDSLIMRDMMTVITKALSEALNQCELWSMDLKHVDADQLMTDLRGAFDPYIENAVIQDLYSDAFGPAWKKRRAALNETLWNKDEMSSGALREPECSCQIVGANGDPDQHTKRDENCPTHGRDPDADRDALQELEQ